MTDKHEGRAQGLTTYSQVHIQEDITDKLINRIEYCRERNCTPEKETDSCAIQVGTKVLCNV